MAADDNLRSVLGSLEATFDARLARTEDEAASDLAFSLLQDLVLAEALERAGPLQILRPGRPAAAVTEIGPDHLTSEASTLIPLGRAVVRAVPTGPLPTTTEQPLLERLRRHARRATRIEVTACDAVHTGVITLACRDHIVIRRPTDGADGLETRIAATFVPLDAIDEIRLRNGT